MFATPGQLMKLEKLAPGEITVNLPRHDMTLERYLEYRKYVINGLNEIASNNNISRKDRNRAQFLLGCVYGYEKYVEENYNKNSVINSQRRRARVRKLENTLTHEEWMDTVNVFLRQCAYCGTDDGHLAQEHFVPVNSGGGYTKENIIPSCKSCNSSKKDRSFYDWYKNHNNCTAKSVYRILSFVR